MNPLSILAQLNDPKVKAEIDRIKNAILMIEDIAKKQEKVIDEIQTLTTEIRGINSRLQIQELQNAGH